MACLFESKEHEMSGITDWPHHQTYLGDCVYISHDGYQIWLRTERDGRIHEIALEPGLPDALTAYERRIRSQGHPD
jgi:hypothetical protein